MRAADSYCFGIRNAITVLTTSPHKRRFQNCSPALPPDLDAPNPRPRLTGSSLPIAWNDLVS